jgi:transposase-like protein
MTTENNFPETLQEAVKYFADADTAHNFLVSMRWPDGVECPRCSSDNVAYTAKRRVWTCSGCPGRRQFSIRVGTIMEDSPISLDKWLVAMWLIISAKNGISSYELHRALGVTQKSAWFLAHRIRLALQQGSFEKMTGTVEADESFIGAKARNMHANKRREKGIGTGGISMTPVMGLLERTDGDKPSRVVLNVLKTRKRKELTERVRECVLKGSEVHTDAFRSYE